MTLGLSLLNKFKSFTSINKKKIVNISLSVLLFVITVINSGYTLTYLSVETMAKTIIMIVSFFIVGFIFAITVDPGVILNRFKKRKPTWAFIAVCIFGFSTILTMFCSGELSSFISYATFFIRILCAYMIAKLFNLKKFISVFQTGLLIVCLIAIFFYIFQFAFNIALTPFPTFTNPKGTVYENYFYLAFQARIDTRMQGPFWEPGLLATFILLALSFEIVVHKKIRWFYIIIYVVSLILTNSTFGYLLMVLVLIFVVNKKVKSFPITVALYVLIFGTIICFFFFSDKIITSLASAFPDVFSKMVTKNGSIRLLDPDRFQSPFTNFKIWLKSPVWGNGLETADRMFEEMMPGMAQTSTLTFYLSQFGILGIAFIFFFFFALWMVKGIEVENKIIFTFLFLILMNKEPHAGIIFDWILMFLFIKEGLDKDTVALGYEKPNENCVVSSFVKNDDASILKRNISTSLIIRGMALIFGFFSYPIYRSYFNDNAVLGVWLSVLSIMAMIISFDLGLGNGLKNKIIKYIVNGDKEKQRELISSTYLSTSAISLLVLLILTPIVFFSNLNAFFQIDESVISPTILKLSTFLVCLSICLEFSLKNVNSLLQAKQKQALSSTFSLLSTVLLMIFAVIFKSSNSNVLLLSIAIAYVFTINVPLLVGTIFTFMFDFKGCAPSFKYASKKSIKEVSTLGIGFFVIQLLLLLINSTNETFITSIFGPTQVVEYTNYYKPFSMIFQLFSIVTLPYWAIVTKEKEEGNVGMIGANIKKLFLYMIAFVVILVGLSVVFQPFINFWLGEEAMTVDYIVVILFDVFIIEWMLVSLFSVVLNGLSVIKWQIIFFSICAVLKVSGCLLLILFKENATWYSVLIVNIIAFIPLIAGEIFIVIKELKKLKKIGECSNENK